jgi:ATP-binding cassette subfamily B protein
MLETLAIVIITLSALIFFNANYDLLALLTVLSLIVVSLVRFLPAFNSIISSIFFIKIYQPSVDILLNELEKIEELKKEKEKEKIKYQNKNFEKNLDTEKNLISLKNITFTYENKKDFTLKNINFNIQRGNIIGVTGETGAGKSTLFHVMLGLLKPNSGTVYFNNKDINSNIENWRDQIGYIAQNIYLLDDTIEKNISFDFLDQKIDNKKMDFAIKISCLEKKISELPTGLKTRVGNDGLRLSGGEKQRVALARAIYRDPDIFFMDESTSALDSETEQKIIENLKQNFSNKTIILIAHRKSTINACDRIINIKDGIISDGKLDD